MNYCTPRKQPTLLVTWKDWAKLELKYPIQPHSATVDEEIGDDVHKLRSMISANTATASAHDIPLIELQRNAKVFLDEIRGLLTECESLPDTATSPISRRNLARKIQNAIESNDGKVSSTILLLARWVEYILFRKVKKNKLIDLDSILRYMSALSTIFREVAYSADILNMDDEDVTLLYCELLKSSTVKDTKYVSERLSDFHRWARREYAVENPDWNELPEVFSTSHVSPGLISESEYQDALNLLMRVPEPNTRLLLAAPILLMFCYRFGLRRDEVRGLLRSDIVRNEFGIITLVQNNRFRRLKTPTSRRQVPLLFDLSDYETELLVRWLDEAESIYGNKLNAPLFGDDSTVDGLMKIAPISKKIIIALRISTSNSDIVLHHARHSTANFVAIALTRLNLHLWENASPLFKASCAVNAEITLLGREGGTRRKMWAVSRFLGHIRRETTAGYYLHFLSDLADLYCSQDKHRNSIPKLKNVIAIDEFPRIAQVNTDLLGLFKPKLANPIPSQILKLMRLIARGRPISEAAESLGIDELVATSIKNLLTSVGKKIWLSKNKLSEREVSTPSHLKLLQRIKEPVWNRLIEFVIRLDRIHTINPNIKIELDGIIDMIGASRQILLWKAQHFSLLAAFLEHMELSEADFRIVKSNSMSVELEGLLHQHGFKSIGTNEIPKVVRFQLDTVRINDKLNTTVQSRFAFMIIENDKMAFRNSIDMLVAFLSFTLALTSHKSN